MGIRRRLVVCLRAHVRAVRAVAALCGCLCAFGCSHTVMQPTLHPPLTLPKQVQGPKERQERDRRAELKVHMRSGELYTLSAWSTSADGARVEGTGTRYSVTRVPGAEGPVSVPISDVALFETSRPEGVGGGGTAALMVMTTISGVLTGICVADPKACFGSCPTFYLEGADPAGRPAAEGFSSSVARALEARDLDAIGSARGGRRYTVTMRNEAFETHAVRRVRLLAAERAPDARVVAGPDGRFHSIAGAAPPASCRAPEGDCLEPIAAQDGVERRSEPDARDLATRETLELAFAPRAGRVALVIAARQTLLSTQLFYQTLAHFGSRAGEYLASVERGGRDAAARTLGMARVLGGIEAEVSEDGGPWLALGSFDEAGPIAGDSLALPFEARGGSLRVRLRAAMGHYRIDQVALGSVVGEVQPSTLAPVAVRRNGRDDAAALERLSSGQAHLVTLPGDAYEIVFALPRAERELELFLESEGYYYEWMREEWLAEENAELAALALIDPAEALRRMAGSIRRGERELEHAFWSSRFRR